MIRRELILKSIVMIAIAVVLLSAAPVKADITNIDTPVLVRHDEGGILSNSPTYDWWYGCSPTSAGMMMGYYDLNGYGGDFYTNLVPGGPAELSSFGNPGALANQIIASSGHITDFYSGGNGASGDDVTPPFHSFNCLADFMGTSQDSGSNPNGSTSWYYFSDGSVVTASTMFSTGPYNDSGMYGLWEYEQYAGYGSGTLAAQNIYNQYIDAEGLTYGFTLAQYQAEIDAGRPVMIHIDNHSMFGYGYTAGTTTINVYDTWAPAGQNPGTLTWGGFYGTTGLDHYGVTVFEPTGGAPVPVPAAVLLGMLGLSVVGIKLRKYA